MSKTKQARIIASLGDHMKESSGSVLPGEVDRFSGFIPSQVAAGEIELDRIIEDPDQPRKTFDEAALNGLAENIKTHGVQQPIQLRWSELHGKWLIVYGHRRFRASILAGLKTIPCIFARDDVDEPTIRIRQLVENCQRQDLAPMEMAQGIEALSTLTGWSNRKIGEELGLNHTTIGRYRSLLALPEDVQQLVRNKDLAPSVAAEIHRVEDETAKVELGRKIATEKLSREQAKEQIDRVTNEAAADSGPAKSLPKQKKLLSQTTNIAVYRNPDASDLRVKKELLAVIEQLDTEKAET